MRKMRYTSRSAPAARAWQRDVRARLARLLHVEDLIAERDRIALDTRVVCSERKGNHKVDEVEISSTPERRLRTLVTRPAKGAGPWPAVVCIHGHSGNSRSPYEKDSPYKGFAADLAGGGYVTIATNIGQHVIYEQGRTVMGERLWDLTRCLDYLATMPEVDKDRFGCAGLSLGGEMAMWLGAMDERVSATVSSGFLTRMDQMEQNHCMCWKFDGLRDLVDFADIYSLIAPRALLCQNGLKEPPSQFPPSLAREALAEIQSAYSDLGSPGNVALVVHEGGHEIDLPSLVAFFERHLGPEAAAAWRSA